MRRCCRRVRSTELRTAFLFGGRSELSHRDLFPQIKKEVARVMAWTRYFWHCVPRRQRPARCRAKRARHLLARTARAGELLRLPTHASGSVTFFGAVKNAMRSDLLDGFPRNSVLKIGYFLKGYRLLDPGCVRTIRLFFTFLFASSPPNRN